MHDPLASSWAMLWLQIKHNVLPYPTDPGNQSSFQCSCYLGGRRLQWLFLLSDPDGLDPVVLHSFIQAIGDGFNFRQLGHCSSIIARPGNPATAPRVPTPALDYSSTSFQHADGRI